MYAEISGASVPLAWGLSTLPCRPVGERRSPHVDIRRLSNVMNRVRKNPHDREDRTVREYKLLNSTVGASDAPGWRRSLSHPCH